MEVYYGSDVKCSCLAGPGWNGTTLVFLKVTPIMATDAQPTVSLVGCVNATDLGVVPLCADSEPAPILVAQDGIAPIIELTATPEDPDYNEMVTITATSSEPLKEAYLIALQHKPDNYNWSSCKPIGWPVDFDSPCNVSQGEWEMSECSHKDFCANWTVMTIGGTGNKTATVSFRNEFRVMDPWFVEVAAHDFSHCNEWPWKHEKWTQESIKFHEVKYEKINLCEGWNLISVQRYLDDPSVGAVLPGSAVHKVYYYTGGDYGYWKYSLYDPLTGRWAGTINTIEPGKGYWVYCSPPEFTLRLYSAPIDPLQVPPVYHLVKGWNLIGFTKIWEKGRDGTMDISTYFASLCPFKAAVLYWWDACKQYWYKEDPDAEIDEWDWDEDDMKKDKGYWLYMTEAGDLAP
jgi:hypothetical protein